MDKFRYVDDWKCDLKKQVSRYEALIDLWGKVEAVKKKDGGEFASVARAVKNATFGPYLMDWSQINVHGRDSSGYYVEGSHTFYTDDRSDAQGFRDAVKIEIDRCKASLKEAKTCLDHADEIWRAAEEAEKEKKKRVEEIVPGIYSTVKYEFEIWV